MKKLDLSKILKIALIFLGALILVLAIFVCLKVKIDAKSALREAKNVRMALRVVDIEMYAQEKCVFDATKKDGVANGVKESVRKLADPDGTYIINSYNYKTHEITSLTYKVKNYYVFFTKEGDAITWDVKYMLGVYHFDETDTKIVKK